MPYYKSYQWKIISNDDRLVSPPIVGPHYDDMGLDGIYDSEEKAIEALDKYLDKLGKDWPQTPLHTYTLITYYNLK